MYKPAIKEHILKDIEYCMDLLFFEEDCLRFWEYIRIEPEKWSEKTMEEQGDGFWVVGIIGKSVIYYNDIEEGYNLSPFTTYGKIDAYYPNQIELHEMVRSIYQQIMKQKNK